LSLPAPWMINVRSVMIQNSRVRTIRYACRTRAEARRARILALSVVWLILAALLLPEPALAQGYTYHECSAVEPESLEEEIAGLARNVLVDGESNLNVDAIVERQWNVVGMDTVLDSEVERAIQSLMVDEPYWERFWSGWSGEKAQEFAVLVTNQVFSSPTFLAKLDELAVAIAADVTAELEAMAARSASTSFLCMQQYVGERYSESLLTLFEREIRTDIDIADFDATSGELSVSQLDTHSKAATGAGIIVATQVVRRISVQLGKKVAGRVAGRIVGRIVGKLGSSLIPIAGWIVGGGLIVWDLIEGGRGALPQIQASLQGEEVKAALRSEIAVAVDAGLDDEIDAMAEQIAAELTGQWAAFCQRHPYLCSLPDENPAFRELLDATSVADLEKLAGLVDVFVETLGRPQLMLALENGAFESLLHLPTQAHQILASTGSPQSVLAWSTLAGDNIDDVVRLGLYESVDSAETDVYEVRALISLDDRAAVVRYFETTSKTRAALLALPPSTRRGLLNRLDPAELDRFIDFLAGEPSADAASLAYRVANGIESPASSRVYPGETVDSVLSVDGAGSSLLNAALVSRSDLEADSGLRQNSVLVAAILLSVVLAISAFALGGWSVVKRRQH
jgi:hypothetical protein